ncbi:hypothetical protein [Mucilaginibacter sp. UR6-11]|uniref:hypothetical protein n=1 Tax=Mucilaginibacter sp. UR6-11 TaxID=1435644 RepID=UPI001E53EC41|nr:hypothetical protein [Mucilaginibacter sp. UR6-11]MCC8427228.1 hypothetical protein [Mucilaginibacter sp. UR6-11]
MIEKTLKTITGQLLIRIPSQLKEVTLGQMMQMQDKEDLTDMDAISILSAIPVSELKNVIDIRGFDVFGETVLSLSNQIKYLYNTDEIPAKVTLNLDGKKTSVNIIRNLSVEPAGAFMAARYIIAEEINKHITLHGEDDWKTLFNPSLKACCLVLAHYFYCRATGDKYNEYKAEAFAETVKKLGVTEALPVAKHFFMSYPDLSKPKTNYWPRFRQFWRKKREYNRLKNLNTSTL